MGYSPAIAIKALTLFAAMTLTIAHRVTAAEPASFAAFDSASKLTVDHVPMDQILGLIQVKDRNKDRIAFSRLKGRAMDYTNAYIQHLESIPVSVLNRKEQLAYWLNLHNIAVIKLIADKRNGHKKVRSYRGTPEKPGKVWLEKTLTVEGQALSLNDIEQDIILKYWDEASVLYGFYFGVQGSPTLEGGAFTGANIEARLQASARRFVNSSKNVNPKRKGLEVSSLYEWHKDRLFEGDDEQLLTHLKIYAEPALVQEIDSTPTITKHRFNWKSVAFIPRSIPANIGTGISRGAGS